MPNETHDNFAPVGVETTAYDLAVDGTIPAELCGTYIRTGPNPTDVAPGEFVIGGLKADGDGMLHGVRLDGGSARWYANRWVRSPELAARFHLPTVPEDAPAGTPDGGRFNGSGNTNVVHHAGRIHALNELSNPYEIAPDLTTRRHENFGGPLPAGMTAHPKFDPDSGEMHVLAYDVFDTAVWYHVVDPGGRLTKGVRIALPASVMVHDMGLTATQVMVMDLPVVFDVERAMRGEKPFHWDPSHASRVGLLPRGADSDADIVWCDVDPCYVYHPMNAYDTGDGRVIADVMSHPTMFADAAVGTAPSSHLHRWTIDPATGRVTVEVRDDHNLEFPRADERRAGRLYRYGYAVGSLPGGGGGYTADGCLVVKFDLTAGTTTAHDFGIGRTAGEFVFVPRDVDDLAPAAEDDGWLLGFVHDRAAGRADLVVLDARDVAGAPVATVHLPVRVPFGYHGNWIPDRALTGTS